MPRRHTINDGKWFNVFLLAFKKNVAITKMEM
jgi:hypothetical protein